MYKLSDEDWANILEALKVYQHNNSFARTFKRVQECVGGR